MPWDEGDFEPTEMIAGKAKGGGVRPGPPEAGALRQGLVDRADADAEPGRGRVGDDCLGAR
jgi:hypothetical protein